MNKLKVHNKRINAWLVVDCGKVYDEKTISKFRQVHELHWVRFRM